ncbi:oxidoreductase [Thermogymnomonas acidicola]|uniref:Oxidoreductase n=1 Tax=Thermogymnomonas acidicola TaxID=399579 RepID=A0AA37BSQ2_9ARCH|nr:Gfo/Idh/MocA family oxidoreductase [Thermogymnomonas acidicola]GGM79349.1 oxidoreductase [Thermogymnomonas acidicola]
MEIVVVGARGFGQVHLNAISGVDVSIVERDRAVAEEIRSKYGVRKVYSSFEEALNSDAEMIDLVVPHNLHREFAVKALRRGKHVLVEKPIATTVREGEEMIAEAKRARKVLMVAEQYYFDTTVRYVMEQIRAGTVGTPKFILVRDQRLFTRTGWRLFRSQMGGGALIDGGIHYVDTMLNFGGDYTYVSARSMNVAGIIEGEDTTVANLQFANGSYGTLLYLWSYRDPPTLPAFEVIGTEGSIYEDPSTRKQGDFRSGRNYVYGDPVVNGKKVALEHADVFRAEMEAFFRAVREGTEPEMKPEVALRDLRCVLDIYRHAGVA